MHNFKLSAVGLFLSLLLNSGLNATIINVDLEGMGSNTDTHVGADGVWSTPGGDVWNSVYAQGYLMYSTTVETTVDTTYYEDVPDEFGNPTPVDIYISLYSDGYDEPVANNLQDSGLYADYLYIVDLLPRQTYDIAVYLGQNSGCQYTDYNGTFPVYVPGGNTPTDSLPGVENSDYVIIRGLQPYDTGDGIYGIRFDTFDGQITGMQIDGVVPEPATLSLLLIGSLATIRKRRTIR